MPNDAVKEAREFIAIVGNCGLYPDTAQRHIKTLCGEVDRLRRRVKQVERDAREDARDAATESYWQQQQGEDYGSY